MNKRIASVMTMTIMLSLLMCTTAIAQQTKWTYSRLCKAIANGNIGSITNALNEGANPNMYTRGTGSLLTQATVHGDLQIIRLLLARGANPRAEGNEGLIFAAIETGRIDVVKAVVNAGARVTDSLGPGSREDVLVDVLWNGNNKILKYLVLHGADTQGTDNVDGGTAFELAAGEGNLEALAILYNGGADINHRNWHGKSALMLACEKGEVEAVRWLLAHGADPTAKDYSNRSAETYAKQYKGKNEKTLLVLCAAKPRNPENGK